jgi:hypothetical protein
MSNYVEGEVRRAVATDRWIKEGAMLEQRAGESVHGDWGAFTAGLMQELYDRDPTAFRGHMADELGDWIQQYVDETQQQSKRGTRRAATRVAGCKKQCMARVWNCGNGGQCMKGPTAGSEFCTAHSKSTGDKVCKEGATCPCVGGMKWQHLGRVDKPLEETRKRSPFRGQRELFMLVVQDDDDICEENEFHKLEEIEYDGKVYMWDSESCDLFDMTVYEEQGLLKKVGNEDFEDDDE